jgi:LPS O-antigen subunit length determinant protein (WzzB/FepE family)
MVQYSLAQSPETIFTVPGKDSPKAREKAMDQLMELMDAGSLPTELIDGFSPQQFIEVKDSATAPSQGEDAITQAVQILSNLATLKLKLQDSRAEALQIRAQIDVLFSDEPVSEEEITNLKDGFKVLKTYALGNLRYREARAQAEHARTVLDQALNVSESEMKSAPKLSEPEKPAPKVQAEVEAEEAIAAPPEPAAPTAKAESKLEPKPKATGRK